jgi:plastocyanin
MTLVAVASTIGMASAGAGGGGCYEAATQGAGIRVEIVHACFSPSILRTDPGATVTFTNTDGMLHALSGSGMGYAELQPGASVTATYATAGIYPYMCHLHPGMSGAVVVGDGRGTAQLVDMSSVRPAAATSPAPAPVSDNGPGALPLVAVGLIAGAAGFAAAWFTQKERRVPA